MQVRMINAGSGGLRSVFLFFVVILTPHTLLANAGADPSINAPYRHNKAQVDDWVQRFERPGREVYDKREQIVATLRLKPGMHIADVGAGTGLYTRLFVPKVGSKGRVYAVDISKPFIDAIKKQAKSHGWNNVVGIVNNNTSTRLPKNSIDLVFVCDTYHHFEAPDKMLASIRRALKSGGRLVIIDFRKDPKVSSPWIFSHVRATRLQVIKEVRAAGYILVKNHGLLQHNYFLEFKRP